MRLILILSLLVTAPAFAQKIKDKFALNCQVELLNGGTPKILSSTQRFPQLDSNPTVTIPFGPHFLQANISISGKSHFAMKPTLSLKLHSGHPVQSMFYSASVSGFENGLKTEPLVLDGFLFKNIKHEKVDFTRVDFECTLQVLGR